MNWYFILLLFFFTCSCKSEKKETHYDDSNVYSLTLDYCEVNPIDSSLVYTGEEDNIPYCYLGLSGKTLDEVIDLLGTPIHKLDTFFVDTHVKSDSYQYESLIYILQNCEDKVPVYTNTWLPRKNKNIYLWLYFVKDGDNFRVIYGEQLDPNKYMNE